MFRRCTNLTRLGLHINALEEIPASLSNLGKLEAL